VDGQQQKVPGPIRQTLWRGIGKAQRLPTASGDQPMLIGLAGQIGCSHPRQKLGREKINRRDQYPCGGKVILPQRADDA
jgi:hypothetical protein